MEDNCYLGQNLRVRWETFISPTKGESSEALKKEKHMQLEDFLHAFLLMTANPAIDREDLVNFCNDIHSVFNILVRQFMNDVQVLTSAEVEPSLANNNNGQVMAFLMHGSGWLILNALCNLSGQALDFNADFVCLLVQFIEEALNLPLGSNNNKEHIIHIPKLESCLQKKSFSKKTLMSIGFANPRKATLKSYPLSSPPSSPVHVYGSPRSWRKSGRGGALDSSDSDVKSGDRNLSQKTASKSSSKHVYTKQAPLPAKAALLGDCPIVNWSLNAEALQGRVSTGDVDGFDLSVVLLSLLENLCQSGVMHSSKRNALALFLAPKLTQLLLAMNLRLHAGSQLSGGWTFELVCNLQKLVLRLVVSLCMYSCTHHYEAPKLASSGILVTLLRIVKNISQEERPVETTSLGVAELYTNHSSLNVSKLHLKQENRTEQICNTLHSVSEEISALDEMNRPHNTPDTNRVSESESTEPGMTTHSLTVTLPHHEGQWENVSSTQVHYISEILHGVLLLLVGIMHSCCENQIVVTHAMALLNEFSANDGYTITKSLIAFADEKVKCFSEDAVECPLLKESIFNLLGCLSKLLIATKRAKLEYLHKFQCLKRMHNNCDYTHYTHHHHSMFGIAHSTYEEDRQSQSHPRNSLKDTLSNPLFRLKQSKCCIAVIIEVLLELVQTVHFKGTLIRILFALEQGGICCCLSPRIFVPVFLKNIEKHSISMRSYFLSVLGKIILEQLGGGERAEGAVYGICDECAPQQNPASQAIRATTKETRLRDHYMSSDSAFCSDGSQPEEEGRSMWWKVLDLYKPLLMSENETLSHQISSHLLHLVRHSNRAVKEELYFNVFLSCFRHSSSDKTDGPVALPCVTSPAILCRILCSLPQLLNTPSAQMQFLVEGGLTHLVQLLDIPSTRPHVLSVFEVLILSAESQDSESGTRNRSNTKDSDISTDSVCSGVDTKSVVKAFADIACTILPYKSQDDVKPTPPVRPMRDSSEDWLQSCEVIEDPIEVHVYRSVQNKPRIEEGKNAFAESLNTLQEVESGTETCSLAESILKNPSQLSKLSETMLTKAADVWRVCGDLLLHSATFKKQFMRREEDHLTYNLLVDALIGTVTMWKMCEGLKLSWPLFLEDMSRLRTVSDLNPAPLKMFMVLLDIAGSLLRICLTLQGQTNGDENKLTRLLDSCKTIWKQSRIFQSGLGRYVAEMLLKVAQMQVYINPGTFCSGAKDVTDEEMLHWDLEELQEAVSSDSQSDVGDVVDTEGYEADSEREREGIHSGECQGEVDMDRVEVTLSQHTLLHPRICLLLLELLECNKDGKPLPAEIACYSIKQITAIARSSQMSQNSLYQCGMPKAVLQIYNQTSSSVEHALLLELFAVLVQQNISTAELREFLRLFSCDFPKQQVMNVDLLPTLLTIVRNTRSPPSHVLTFPVIKPNSETLDSGRSDSTVTATMTSLDPADIDATSYGQLSGKQSPWSVAPVQLPIHGGLPWPPTGKGFFMTAWLRVDELRVLSRLQMATGGAKRKAKTFRQSTLMRENKKTEVFPASGGTVRLSEATKTGAADWNWLHLFSVGNQELLVEVWIEARPVKITIRLSRTLSPDVNLVLHEATSSNLLSLGLWQHLSFGYEEKVDGSTRTGTISLIVNGQLHRDILIEYTYSCPVSAQSSVPYCLLGHCVQEEHMDHLPHGSWQLGNVLLFSDARALTQELAFHQYSLGPDCLTISCCESSRQRALYSRYITQDVIRSGLCIDILTGNQEVDMRQAREALVVSYSPSNKDSFSHYETPTQFGSTFGRVLSGQSRNSILQCPSNVGAAMLCTVTSSVHRGLQKAIHECGGISIFVFLFAKIVEISSSCSIQAKALKFLMQLRACSLPLAVEFHEITAASMIAQVLQTSKCFVGFEMLKVILDACLSRSLLYQCCQSGEYRIHREMYAIIQDTSLVSQLLLAWRVWEKAESGVLKMMFGVIATLIHEDHPDQVFNVTQLQSIRFVNRLLMMCKERHHEDLPSLPPHACCSIVSIIKGLMGQPPDVNLLAEVCDFLLAVHPAVNTFVCHAQSSFYFSHHSFAQQDYKQKFLRRMSHIPTDESSQPRRLQSQSSRTSDIVGTLETVSESVTDDDNSSAPVPSSPDQTKRTASPSPSSPDAASTDQTKPLPKPSPDPASTDQDKVSDLSGLVAGLIHLLVEELVVLPDASLTKVLGIVIKPDTLIVLAHHESPLIRTRVIQLLDVYFHRANPSQTQAFLKRRGFHLLANQLHQYPATMELMEACLTITVGKPVDITQGLELMLLQESDRFQDMSSILLMSLLENSVHDFDLCHGGICIANQLFEGVESIADVMLAHGLIETLCNVLSALCSNDNTRKYAKQPLRTLYSQRSTGDSSDDDSYQSDGKDEETASNNNVKEIDNVTRDSEVKATPEEASLNVTFTERTSLYSTPSNEKSSNVALTEETSSEATLAGDASSANVTSLKTDLTDDLSLIEPPKNVLETCDSSVRLSRVVPNSEGDFAEQNDGTSSHDSGDSGEAPQHGTADESCEITEELQILIKDIQHFMACIANRVFSSSSQFVFFENMMMLLEGVEENLRGMYEQESAMPDVVYQTQSYILNEVLLHFQATAMSTDSAVTRGRKSSAFQRSISYSERKYEEYKWNRGNSLDSISSRGNSYGDSGLAFIPEYSYPDRASVSSEQDLLSNFGQRAEDRRYSAQLDTVLRMQRVRASSTASRPDKKKTPEIAGEQLLTKHFKKVCHLSVNLIVERDPYAVQLGMSGSLVEDGPEPPVESAYVQLAKQLFHRLTDALSSTMEKVVGQRKQWESVLWSSREMLRHQLGHLLLHMVAPWQPAAVRVYMLQVACLQKAAQILPIVLHSRPEFELFIFDLMSGSGSDMSDANKALYHQLTVILEECSFHPLNPKDMDKAELDTLKIEISNRMRGEQSKQDKYIKQRLEAARSARTKLDSLAREVSNSAMEVTQLVAAYQNGQRLRFLEFLKSTIASSLDIQSAWQEITQSLTHERAVWYDPKSYPSSWQLDPTEGPSRVRRRLQRCHLGIPSQFLISQLRENYMEHPPVPLGYLFQDSVQSSDSSEFKRRLQKNEKISCAFYCKLVTPGSETKGDLLQGVNSMYFVSEEIPERLPLRANAFEHDMLTISWLYEDIKELHLRWYQLRDNSLEIFLTNGQTLLLAFENMKERDQLYQQIKSCDLPNLVEVDNISDVTHSWRLGQMTNYEYLTQLNKLAGRSFNDLMQYPVFPFVLCDYTSKELDLENPKSYRDLTRPVSVQNQAMEAKYRENYKFLKDEYQKNKGLQTAQTMFCTKPYHYGSHYSNSGTVLQYLVRLPPFTKMFLLYQDNHFDLPDRTFHSIDTSWRLSSFQSPTDVKELIPEFFFLPEFLQNSEGFDFGLRQSGPRVHHVILPDWAKGSARLFVQIHRQALESVYASKYLHSWVDLVFGVKQQGTLAVEAVNVFHPATYFGIDTTLVKDPVKQRAVETMIKTYGQTPKQLFVNYHPPRPEQDIFPDNFSMGSVAWVAGLSQRQFTKANTGPEASSVWGPVNTVLGMRWGNYLGSASNPDPVIRYQKRHPVALTSLIPLPTGDVCGVAHRLCLLLMLSKEKGVTSMNATDIKWSGIVSWGYPDHILRVQAKRKALLLNLLHTPSTDKITCCNSVSDCRRLFVGTASGVITAYPTRYNPEKQCNIEVVGTAIRLFGHTARINSLCVCRTYSILVSASQDGTCIIWDLNRICYVRSLCDSNVRNPKGIDALAVSDVTGDIATATRTNEIGSDVSLWTVNAALVSRRLCDSTVGCLTFSGAPEGIAVNSLVGGCEDGVIRFWSTIDLTPIRVLVPNSQSHSPIVSLTFANDSQYLLASERNGVITAWGNKESNRRVPKVEAFLGTRKIRNPSQGRVGSISGF